MGHGALVTNYSPSSLLLPCFGASIDELADAIRASAAGHSYVVYRGN
ncbi:hypothetical protein JYQ62_06985 [Nostoc sp. UHCC 0702]|nr:hypothetical protein JYQ62_06985 [Nostoc sp. UHCC 0702]